MFSGIIQAVVSVCSIYEETNFKTYTVILPKEILSGLTIGSSLSNNGCCLTIISIKHNLVSFNLIHETLRSTNMSFIRIGDLINIEKPLGYCHEIGGHLMSGHIDCTGKIKKIFNLKGKNKIIWIKIKNQDFQKYLMKKGSIGVNGVSLTITKIINNYIRICLTPYTLKTTNLGVQILGDIVNIETDFIIKSIVDNVERILLSTNFQKSINPLYKGFIKK